ncbi:MAG: phosphoribosylformylglycinamidine cyclo-ligase [Candidatus Rokubacteria bacterium]|nr:phosphoribosylformylglycinamidine cyclo-ligase [Candidatus Rokubacteria bacterium]
MDPLTYKQSGVDIEAAEAAIRRIGPLAKSTFRPEVLGEIGAFAGFVKVPAGYREPVLVSSTDGVGSKLKVAFLADRHDTVGIDLVAMGVNDVLVHGAEPLFFLDYMAVGKVVPEKIEAVVRGVAEGCRQAGCSLVGGETAELPDFYAPGEYDLAGFCVGVAERSRIIDGSTVTPGDRLIGLASSGLHSNGYSLARKVVFELMGLKVSDVLPGLGRTVADVLLTPTRIYVKPVLELLKAGPVRAMAHITGGGLTGNLPRVLPTGCKAVIERGAWTVPPIFTLIRETGKIAEEEMFRTFNMGIGLSLVVAREHADHCRALLTSLGETAWIIGEIQAGSRGVEYVGAR